MNERLFSSTRKRACPPIRGYIFQDRLLFILQSWFQEAGCAGVEDVAIAAGYPTNDGDAVVAAVLHPNAQRTRGWYEQRDGAAWDELYDFGHRHGMYYLLQLHTHPPGLGTRHSPRDNAGAFCDRIGFLSIVVPDFALGGLDLHDSRLTVHERVASGWRVWPRTEAQGRLIVVPADVDLQHDHDARAKLP